MFWKLLLKCFEMFWFIRCSVLKFGLELDANVLVTSSGIETTASWCTVNGMMTTCHHGSSGSLYPPKFFNVFHVVGNMGETVWNLKSAEARAPAEFGPGGKPLSCEICWRIHERSLESHLESHLEYHFCCLMLLESSPFFSHIQRILETWLIWCLEFVLKLISILRAFVSQFPVVSNLMKTQGWMILPLSLQRLVHCDSWRANLGTATKFSKRLVSLRLFNTTVCQRWWRHFSFQSE